MPPEAGLRAVTIWSTEFIITYFSVICRFGWNPVILFAGDNHFFLIASNNRIIIMWLPQFFRNHNRAILVFTLITSWMISLFAFFNLSSEFFWSEQKTLQIWIWNEITFFFLRLIYCRSFRPESSSNLSRFQSREKCRLSRLPLSPYIIKCNRSIKIKS